MERMGVISIKWVVLARGPTSRNLTIRAGSLDRARSLTWAWFSASRNGRSVGAAYSVARQGSLAHGLRPSCHAPVNGPEQKYPRQPLAGPEVPDLSGVHSATKSAA